MNKLEKLPVRHELSYELGEQEMALIAGGDAPDGPLREGNGNG